MNYKDVPVRIAKYYCQGCECMHDDSKIAVIVERGEIIFCLDAAYEYNVIDQASEGKFRLVATKIGKYETDNDSNAR